jgi:hypothetical protein
MDIDTLCIQKMRVNIFYLARDKVRFTSLDSKMAKFPISALIDSRYFKGDFSILERAVKQNKNIWVVVDMKNKAGSQTGIRALYLTDAFFTKGKEPEVNPSQRTKQ